MKRLNNMFASALFLTCILLVSACVEAFSPASTEARPCSRGETPMTSLFALQPGEKVPWTDIHWGFNPPTIVAVPPYCGLRNVVIVGIPAAFANNAQIPTYMNNSDLLKSLGVDEVIVVSVNDGAVMGVYQQKINTVGTIVTFFADPHGTFMDMCGTRIPRGGDSAEWEQKGFFGRSKPFAMYVEGCVVKHFVSAESDADPATHADAMIEAISRVKNEANSNASQTYSSSL